MTLHLDRSDGYKLHQQGQVLEYWAWKGWEAEGVSECLGQGYSREIELYPGVWLNCTDRFLYQVTDFQNFAM